jgi:hypothetical protein
MCRPVAEDRDIFLYSTPQTARAVDQEERSMSDMEKAMAEGSVFTVDYLDALSAQDEPGGAEGELAGPWKVAGSGAGRWNVVRLWEGSAKGSGPRVVAPDRETALLFAATLPGVGRPKLFRRDTVEGGARVEGDGQVSVELEGLGEEALSAAHVSACLARSPWALAMVLEAAGPAVQRMVGEILFQRLR